MMQTKSFVTPVNNDVLCGRGSISFSHPGNRVLREKIARHIEKYVGFTSRKAKTVLIHEIILSVMKEGGRFLQYDKQANQWFNGGLDAAKNRVGSAFRDASAPGKVKCIKELRASMKRKRSETEYTQHVAPSPSVCVPSNQAAAYHYTDSIPPQPHPSTATIPLPSLQRQVASCPASLLSLCFSGVEIESSRFDPIDSDSEEEEGGLDACSASSILEVLAEEYPDDDYYPTTIFVPKK